jgi:hypothetical protein
MGIDGSTIGLANQKIRTAVKKSIENRTFSTKCSKKKNDKKALPQRIELWTYRLTVDRSAN